VIGLMSRRRFAVPPIFTQSRTAD